MLPSRLRLPVLTRPRRGAADVVVHLDWDDLACTDARVGDALVAWVRRCRGQGVRVHVDVVSPLAVQRSLVLGLCATSLGMHVALPIGELDEPAPGRSADRLCAQLHLSGAGARVVGRCRATSVAFTPSLPVLQRPVAR